MNESAFPWSVDDGQKIVGNKGMTLRDYFAAKAMQGMLAANGDANGHLEYIEKMVAESAFKLADAMLKARQK